MRLTTEQLVSIVDEAIASGRVNPAHRDRWLARMAAGGPRGFAAVMAAQTGFRGPVHEALGRTAFNDAGEWQ